MDHEPSCLIVSFALALTSVPSHRNPCSFLVSWWSKPRWQAGFSSNILGGGVYGPDDGDGMQVEDMDGLLPGAHSIQYVDDGVPMSDDPDRPRIDDGDEQAGSVSPARKVVTMLKGIPVMLRRAGKPSPELKRRWNRGVRRIKKVLNINSGLGADLEAALEDTDSEEGVDEFDWQCPDAGARLGTGSVVGGSTKRSNSMMDLLRGRKNSSRTEMSVGPAPSGTGPYGQSSTNRDNATETGWSMDSDSDDTQHEPETTSMLVKVRRCGAGGPLLRSRLRVMVAETSRSLTRLEVRGFMPFTWHA